MIFPKFYPTQCPPADSTEPSGTFYRVIVGKKPQQSDFEPYWVQKPHKQREWIKNGQACTACGLSVNTTIEDAKKKQDTIPSLRGKKIAVGILEVEMGKIKPTPTMKDPNHHTWWIPKSIENASVYFKVVA